MVIFRKIVIIFLGRNTPDNKLTKSCGTNVEVIYYELGAINLYLEGGRQLVLAVFASTISQRSKQFL